MPTRITLSLDARDAHHARVAAADLKQYADRLALTVVDMGFEPPVNEPVTARLLRREGETDEQFSQRVSRVQSQEREARLDETEVADALEKFRRVW